MKKKEINFLQLQINQLRQTLEYEKERNRFLEKCNEENEDKINKMNEKLNFLIKFLLLYLYFKKRNSFGKYSKRRK